MTAFLLTPVAQWPCLRTKDTSAPTPAVSGYVSQGNLNLDAGCRYNLFEASHATQCMQGSWIMMTGSSNTLLESLGFGFDPVGLLMLSESLKL